MLGEGTTGRRCLGAGCAALSRGNDILGGTIGQPTMRSRFEPQPDLALPKSIETFDGRLETRFVRRGKHGNDSQAQAQPRHASNRIGVLAWPLETRIVVELGVSGKSHSSPMFHQTFHHGFCVDGPRRPRHGQPSMQRNARQNGHFRPAVDHQAFDGVEAVQFGLSLGYVGEIPTFRRRRPSHTAASIQDAVPSQNATDRRNCGTRLNLSGLHFSVNGRRAIFAQHACSFNHFRSRSTSRSILCEVRCGWQGARERSDQSIRSRRFPCAHRTQY